jgi:hypothetical protein
MPKWWAGGGLSVRLHTKLTHYRKRAPASKEKMEKVL